MLEVPRAQLLEVADRYGTPTYAYDVAHLYQHYRRLRERLPSQIEILYSIKANPALSPILAPWGLGAEVASAGELSLAIRSGFPTGRILIGGPYKSPEVLEQARTSRDLLLSVDSIGELALLADSGGPYRVLLRLRPDFSSTACVPTGLGSRFGVPIELIEKCRKYLNRGVSVVGFHVFAGSQVLAATAVVDHLERAFELCLRAADILGIVPELIDLGGGFGVPYGRRDRQIDLEEIGPKCLRIIERAAPARLVLELGRYIVAEAGWYLVTVYAHQDLQERPAVVVDGGIHHRFDLCGVDLRRRGSPPVSIRDAPAGPFRPTDVLGCLCLPEDVLAEAALLPPLLPGDRLAFPKAGAYGLSASPALFLGHPPPAEVAFDGDELWLLGQAETRPNVVVRTAGGGPPPGQRR